MPETKRPETVGTPSVVKTQLLGLARACNDKKTKTKSFTEHDSNFDNLVRACSNMDSDLTKAMLLIYNPPIFSHQKIEEVKRLAKENKIDEATNLLIEIKKLDSEKDKDTIKKLEELAKENKIDEAISLNGIPTMDISDLDPEKNAGTIREMRTMLNEGKIKEAISLIEEAMADESKIEFPGVKGVSTKAIEDIRKYIKDFKPVWEKYLSVHEEGKRNESIESLQSKRARLVESREARMEDVASYDRQIARIDGDIRKLKGETKEKIAEVIPFPEKPKEVATIVTEGPEATVTSLLEEEPHEEMVAEKIAADPAIVDRYLDQIMKERDIEQLVILRELQKRVKGPRGSKLELIKGQEPPDEPA